jgi:hypothetical protein
MRTITTIGLDIAKSVFQIHGVDAVGQVVRLHSRHPRKPTMLRAMPARLVYRGGSNRHCRGRIAFRREAAKC